VFVATFLGSPQMNIYKGLLGKENGELFITFGDNKVFLPNEISNKLSDLSYIGREVLFGIRPEDVKEGEGSQKTSVKGRVDVVERLGNEALVHIDIEGGRTQTTARVNNDTRIVPGTDAVFTFDMRKACLFDAKTEWTILGVPEYNKIPAKLIKEEGGLYAYSGKAKFALPDGYEDRLLDRSVIGKDILLGIKSSSVSAAPFEGGQHIPVTLRQIERQGKHYEGYFEYAGKKEFLAVPLATDKIESDAGLYFLPDDCQIFDLTSGRLSVSEKINKNILGAKAIKIGKYSVVTGKGFRLITKNNISGDIFIDPRRLSVTKADTKKYRGRILKTTVISSEYSGDLTHVVFSLGGRAMSLLSEKNLSFLKKGDRLKIAAREVINA
jgi:ABC-type sugar transport systems, ATPase components